MYWVALNPFIHHYGNLFLVYQSSTWLLDFYAILKILNWTRGEKLATLILRWLHPIVFGFVRLLIGVPLSIKFQRDMFLLLIAGNPHDAKQIIFIVIGNFCINIINAHWFFDMVFGARDPLRDCSDTASVKESGESLSKWRFEDKLAVGHDTADIKQEVSFGRGRKSNTFLNILRLFATIVCLLVPFCLLNNKNLELKNYKATLDDDLGFKREITDMITGRAELFVDELMARRSKEEIRRSLHLDEEDEVLDIGE